MGPKTVAGRGLEVQSLVVSCRQDYLDALVIIVRFAPLKAEDRIFGAFVEGNVRPGELRIDKIAGG